MRESSRYNLAKGQVGRGSADANELLYACEEFGDKVVVVIQGPLLSNKFLFVGDEVNKGV